MLDCQVIKITAEIGGQLGTLQPQPCPKQIGIAQGQHHPRAVHRLVRQIDHPAAAQVNRVGYRRRAPFDHAVLERKIRGQRQLIAQRARDHGSVAQSGAHLPQHAVTPRIIGNLERRHWR